MSDYSLLELFRKTAVNVAVDVLSTIQQAKKAAEDAACGEEEGGEPALRRVRAPSPVTVSDFLGEVAGLGLDQVNGVLRLRARYGDVFAKWLADYLWPKRHARLPPPKLVEIRSHPGGTSTTPFLVSNGLRREARVKLRIRAFRTESGDKAPRISITLSPHAIDLAPDQAWVFHVEMRYSTTESPSKPLDPGRYVCLVEAHLGDHLADRMLLDILLEAEAPRAR
jgi:hypothetical protein